MKYKFLPAAEKDLIDAVSYYETCEYNLGIDFAIEENRTIARIIEYRTAWIALTANNRDNTNLSKYFYYGI
jgi:toxin ParE1/3/4